MSDKYRGAVFFDLDGTLLDNRTDEIPKSAQDALGKLKANRYIVCLATGRDMEAVYSRRYLSVVSPDAVIHMNGTRITAGETVILQHYMDRDLLRRLIGFSKKNGFSVGTSIGPYAYYTDPEMKARNDRKWNRYVRRNFRPADELLERNIPVMAVDFAADDILAVKRSVEEVFPEIELFPFNSNTGADAVEKGFSKAKGIETVCSYFGIDLKNTWAFGDSMNDIPMLRKASVGVAMGNADPEVRKAADMETDTVAEHGIRNALVRLGLICAGNG